MIPCGDDVGGSKEAWVTPLLIAFMVLVYAGELCGFLHRDMIMQRFALYPHAFIDAPISNFYRLFTCEFIHKDILHVSFNMLFLFAFGRTIEKIIGSWVYLAAVAFMGFPGSLFDILIHQTSDIPRLGASGIITTIMGMYLTLAYWARIKIFLSVVGMFSRPPYELPSWTMLIYFLVLQLLSLGASEKSGVAYDIHVVCFIFGLGLGQILKYVPFVQDNIEDIHAHPAHLKGF